MPDLIKNVAGQLTEEPTVSASAGAADAGKVPELGTAGILDDSVLGAATSGADKVLKTGADGKLDPDVLDATAVSTGAADAGKLVAYGPDGRLDPTVLPTGVGADVESITASEALSAGDYVNIWNSAGPKARKADAGTAGKEAMGFVKVAVAPGAQAQVYFEGRNDAVTGQVAGHVYLDPANPGKGTGAPPSAAGEIEQLLGFATSATSVNFQYNRSILKR